jgi:HK97 family phage major capsid protein
MLKQKIAEVREKLGRAIEAAKGIATKMREEPEKLAELEESFQKAMADITPFQKELNRLEQEQELEALDAELTKPAETFKHQVGATETAAAEALKVERNEQHNRAFRAFLKGGDRAAVEQLKAYSPQEQHALLGSQDDLGGFLIPPDFRAEIIRNIAGFAVMRPICRVITTGTRAVSFPKLTGGTDPYSSDLATGSSNWKGESGGITGGTVPTTQDKPTFALENIPVHVWQPDAIELGRDLLEDEAVGVESLLAELLGEVKALDEDTAFINGTGVGMPEGVLGSGASEILFTQAFATGWNWTDVVNLFIALPAQYRQNAKWLMNSPMYGMALKMISVPTYGSLVFPPNSLPGTMMSKPVVISEFCPAIAASAVGSVSFGDFSSYYIVDRVQFRIQRLVEKYAPNLGVLASARTGGQCVRTAGIKLGKLAAA